MHIIGQENANSAKTLLYYGPKESIACPFFLIFLSKKRPLSQNTVLSCHFFQIFRNLLLSFTRTVKNRWILSKLHSIMVWIGFPYFPSLNEKISALCAYLVKDVHSLKSKQLSCSYFIKKRPFSQENGALMSFFHNFS